MGDGSGCERSGDGGSKRANGSEGERTNNVAELMGVQRAVEWAVAHGTPVTIRYDSKYAADHAQERSRVRKNTREVAAVQRAVRAAKAEGHGEAWMEACKGSQRGQMERQGGQVGGGGLGAEHAGTNLRQKTQRSPFAAEGAGVWRGILPPSERLLPACSDSVSHASRPR